MHVSGYAVVIANGSGQRLSDFGLTADADFAFVVRLRRRIWCGGISDGSGGLAQRAFVVSGVVFVGGTHGDFVSRIVAGEGIGVACLVGNRLTVTQPLVLHVSGYAVVIANGSGQRLPDFGLTTDADFAFVIRLRRRIWCRGISDGSGSLAQRVFVVSGVVFVAGFDADVVSRVGAGELVGCTRLSADGLAVA